MTSSAARRNEHLVIRVGRLSVMIGRHPVRHVPLCGCGATCERCREWRTRPLCTERTMIGPMHPAFLLERNWIHWTRRNTLRRQAVQAAFTTLAKVQA